MDFHTKLKCLLD